MPSLLERLKERRLVQWTVAYLAGAFVVLQVMDALEGPLGLTQGVQSAVLILLVVGLLITLVLAWYHGEKGHQRVSGPEFVLIMALFGVAGLLLMSNRPEQEASGGVPLPVSSLDPRRIAVLPFEHRSATDGDEYFTDGIRDDLLSQLAKLSGLTVISRTSLERYAGTTKSVPEIAREVGAGTVIEGGVQRVGERVRINIQVIDGTTDSHLWSETFDDVFSVQTLFEVQGAIVVQVADAVHATLLPSERSIIGTVPTTSDEAYELYKRGRFIWLHQVGTDFDRVAALYERAVAIDSEFALAYAGLAEVYGDMAGLSDTDVPLSKARAAGQRALSLDPDLSEAHAALGYITHWFDWDSATARGHFEQAVRLSPSNSLALSDYGRFLLNFGDIEEAVANLRRAAELDPGTAFLATGLGRALYMAGRPREAVAVLEGALRLQPSPYTHLQLGYALFSAGRPEEALREARLALVEAGRDSVWVMAGLAELMALTGDIEGARPILSLVKEHPTGPESHPVGIAWVYVAMSEPDSAFAWLERAVQSRNRLLIERKLRSTWADPIRADPRYDRFLDRIGLGS